MKSLYSRIQSKSGSGAPARGVDPEPGGLEISVESADAPPVEERRGNIINYYEQGLQWVRKFKWDLNELSNY
jgi:hypothetical protein